MESISGKTCCGFQYHPFAMYGAIHSKFTAYGGGVIRDKFLSSGDILGYYYYLKANVTCMPTIMPKRDNTSQSNNARVQQSIMEEKFAFIGTIERFARWYYSKQQTRFPIPEDCLLCIFHVQFCRGSGKYQSWGELATYFSKRIRQGDPIPRRLQHRQHLCDLGYEMKISCEKYFEEIGLFT